MLGPLGLVLSLLLALLAGAVWVGPALMAIGVLGPVALGVAQRTLTVRGMWRSLRGSVGTLALLLI
ncbi:MAG: hypothetical protein ACK5PI_04910 [Acetobacteraceae bacterium]